MRPRQVCCTRSQHTLQNYTGYVVKDKGEGIVQVEFLRRVPVKNPSLNCVRFYYPMEDNIKVVVKTQIILGL